MILGISGSLRAMSTNAALLRTAAELDDDVVLFGGMAALPHFDPDADVEPLPAAVAALRTSIEKADAVIVCTPVYAGGLPGSFKNMLDWTVGSTVMSSRPTAIINASAFETRQAETALRIVLGYVDAEIVEAACVSLAVHRHHVNELGFIDDPEIVAGIAAALTTIRTHLGRAT